MKKQISSIMTYPNKFIVPFIPVGLAVLIDYFIDRELFTLDSLPMISFFLIISIAQSLQYMNIKKVVYDDNNLIVSSLSKKKKHELKNVIRLRRTFFDFYKITIRTENGKSTVKFMPSFNDKMTNLFGERKSIKEFRQKLEETAANSGE